VLLFDESYNSITKNKQMDVLVHIWLDNRVASRYLCSVFMGHGRADNILEHFMSCTDGIGLQNILQVSMDGPNVNWSFYEKMQQKVKSECGCQMLNIGSCGLHIVHGAFKHGCNATKWDIQSVLRAVYTLFKETPARSEDYTTITGSDVFPRNFCSTRWLENVPVAERVLEMWPHLKLCRCSQERRRSYATIEDLWSCLGSVQ